MTTTLPPWVKAGRLIRLVGWIQMTIALIVLGVTFVDARGPIDPLLLGALGIPIAASLLLLVIGAAVKRHRQWGRVAGIVVAALWLLGFPILTVVGVLVLHHLITGWHGSADRPEGTAAVA